jgi:hypothetical protein
MIAACTRCLVAAHDNPLRFTNASHRSLNRSELCSTHQSLSRSTVHRHQETPSASHRCRRPYWTMSSRAALWGYRATLSVAHGWNGEEHMRQPTAAIAVAVICVLTGCAVTTGNAESTTPTRSMIPRPLVERELAGLLLSPEQVNVAMGVTGMTVACSL